KGAGEGIRQKCRDIECRIVEQLLAHPSDAGQLVGPKGELRELCISLGIGRVLTNPGGRAMVHDDRDNAVAGSGLNDPSELPHDVLLLKRLDKLTLELVRHEVAAVSIDADLQNAHFLRPDSGT